MKGRKGKDERGCRVNVTKRRMEGKCRAKKKVEQILLVVVVLGQHVGRLGIVSENNDDDC